MKPIIIIVTILLMINQLSDSFIEYKEIPKEYQPEIKYKTAVYKFSKIIHKEPKHILKGSIIISGILFGCSYLLFTDKSVSDSKMSKVTGSIFGIGGVAIAMKSIKF